MCDHAEEKDVDQNKSTFLFENDGFRYIVIVALFLTLSNFVCQPFQASVSLSLFFFFFNFLYSEIMFLVLKKFSQSRVDVAIFYNIHY